MAFLAKGIAYAKITPHESLGKRLRREYSHSPMPI
jgi:hypothetical protein